MGKKVLLAEDSLTIQKVFELAFRGSDISLTMVDNGEDAVRLAGEVAPDLVVADVTLPGKNGFEVAAALSISGRPKSVPVLILSGTLVPFDEEKFRKSGASGVLFKPFESQELFEKVETMLRGGAPPGGAGESKAEEKRPAAEETWDFTDVIEEAEREAASDLEKSKPPAAPLPHGAELLGGLTAPSPGAEGHASLGDFDVSLDDIEAGAREAAAGPAAPLSEVVKSFDEAVAEGAAPLEEGADKAPPHITGELFQDAPPPVTDLTAALESVGELDDLEARDEMALLEEEVAAREKLREREAPPEPAPAPSPEIRRPASFGIAVEGEPRARPPGAQPGGEVQDEFSTRAREIFEKVAAEAAERAMWDVMERLSGEFSARVREAVEAVAWEVIPPTAETLIREEIARISGKAEKKSS